MNHFAQELLEIADKLDSAASKAAPSEVVDALNAIENAAVTVSKTWSGSWMGYHATVYYDGFKSPPAGAHFSPEWGLMDTVFDDTKGDWKEFNRDKVIEAIYRKAGVPH